MESDMTQAQIRDLSLRLSKGMNVAILERLDSYLRSVMEDIDNGSFDRKAFQEALSSFPQESSSHEIERIMTMIESHDWSGIRQYADYFSIENVRWLDNDVFGFQTKQDLVLENFNPDQPRWPKGTPVNAEAGGGRFQSSEGTMSSEFAAQEIKAGRQHELRRQIVDWTHATEDFNAIVKDPDSAESKAFLKQVRKIKPMQTNRPIYRGMSFATEAERQEFVANVKSYKGLKMDRTAASFSKNQDVAERYSQARHGGRFPVMLELQEHKTARDISHLVREALPHRAYQEEALILHGTLLKLKSIKENTGTSGQGAGNCVYMVFDEDR